MDNESGSSCCSCSESTEYYTEYEVEYVLDKDILRIPYKKYSSGTNYSIPICFQSPAISTVDKFAEAQKINVFARSAQFSQGLKRDDDESNADQFIDKSVMKTDTSNRLNEHFDDIVTRDPELKDVYEFCIRVLDKIERTKEANDIVCSDIRNELKANREYVEDKYNILHDIEDQRKQLELEKQSFAELQDNIARKYGARSINDLVEVYSMILSERERITKDLEQQNKIIEEKRRAFEKSMSDKMSDIRKREEELEIKSRKLKKEKKHASSSKTDDNRLETLYNNLKVELSNHPGALEKVDLVFGKQNTDKFKPYAPK